MFKKTVTYIDFNGNERTEDCFFHLSSEEVLRLEKNKNRSLTDQLREIQETQDEVVMLDLITDLIRSSYGIKSEDGLRFRKSKELSKEFSETEAYSKIFMDIMTDEKEVIAFVTGILPKEMAQVVDKSMAEQAAADGAQPVLAPEA